MKMCIRDRGDTGLTGRKIIVDTYGGYARHGGGAFSGKDPSGSHRQRCGLAKQCEVQVAYAIGVAKPVSIMVDTFGTGTVSDEKKMCIRDRLCTLLNIVLYALFNKLFGYTAANSWGNVLDNIICILFAYCTNRAFVFRSKTQGKAMAREFGAFVT